MHTKALTPSVTAVRVSGPNPPTAPYQVGDLHKEKAHTLLMVVQVAGLSQAVELIINIVPDAHVKKAYIYLDQ